MSKIQKPSLTIAREIIKSEQINDTTKRNVWQIALAIGIPSAIIIAYLYYRKTYRNNNKNTQTKQLKNDKSNKQSNDSICDKKESITNNKASPSPTTTQQSSNDDQNKSLNKTGLEKAIEIKDEGNKYFKSKQYKEALDCYTRAIEICPKNDTKELPKLYQNRAAAHENLKMYENVIDDCDKALELDPNYTKALLRRAKSAELTGKLEMAFEDFTVLCIIENFQNNATITSADQVVKQLGEKMCKEKLQKQRDIPISQHFVTNFFIGLNNDPIFRNKSFSNEINSNENADEIANIKSALESFNNGDYSKCIHDCTLEINNNGKYLVEALNLRGTLYMLKCQFDNSVDDFNRILSDANASNRIKSNTLIKMTALNLQRNDDRSAFENYDKAIEIDPTNEDIYCNRAQVLSMKGRFEEGFNDFDKAIELNPNHKIANLQLSFFKFRKFYAEIAMEQSQGYNNNILSEKSHRLLDVETRKLESLIEKYHEVAEAYSLYAQVLSEQGQYEKAEKYYGLALKLDPKNAALLVQRALNTMTWRNDLENTIKMLEDAIKIDNTCEFAFETLATVEIQRGNLPRAIELFEKSIELTRNEESMSHLCSMLIGAKTQLKVLHKCGDMQQAFNMLNLGVSS